MKVKKVNGQPDIPEGLEWKSFHENPDRKTYTVILSDEYYAKQNESIKAVSQMYVAEKILASSIPENEMDKFIYLFDAPIEGEKYKKDWILRDKQDGLFKVVNPEWDGKSKEGISVIKEGRMGVMGLRTSEVSHTSQIGKLWIKIKEYWYSIINTIKSWF